MNWANHHTVAAISIAGSCLDVLGSLYLAYDLLGGPHGPLRLLTRMVTYSILFGLGYGLGMRGLLFGVAAGAATGITIALELDRMASHQDHYGIAWEAVFSAMRACAWAAALYPQVGLRFAAAYAGLLTGGQVIAYLRGIRPALNYSANRKPRFTRVGINATLVRTVGYFLGALACSFFVRHVEHPWRFSMRLGLITGLITGLGMAFSPYVEYYADNMPQRLMGVFGVALMFCGFALQSLQYWLAVFDVHLS
jgi:hypothetical protein